MKRITKSCRRGSFGHLSGKRRSEKSAEVYGALQSGRNIIAAAIDTTALSLLADSVTNDGMQALLTVLRKRDVPGGLGDSRAIREAFHAVVLDNIARHALELLGAGRTYERNIV